MLAQAMSSTIPTTIIRIGETAGPGRLPPGRSGFSRASSSGTAVALASLVVDRERLFEVREDGLAGSRAPARPSTPGLEPRRTLKRNRPRRCLVPVEARLHDHVHRHRHPDRRPAAQQRAGEVLRRDADDRERRPVERQRLARRPRDRDPRLRSQKPWLTTATGVACAPPRGGTRARARARRRGARSNSRSRPATGICSDSLPWL